MRDPHRDPADAVEYAPPIAAGPDKAKAWCSCSDTDRRWFGVCGRCPDLPGNRKREGGLDGE